MSTEQSYRQPQSTSEAGSRRNSNVEDPLSEASLKFRVVPRNPAARPLRQGHALANLVGRADSLTYTFRTNSEDAKTGCINVITHDRPEDFTPYLILENPPGPTSRWDENEIKRMIAGIESDAKLMHIPQ
ncbi:unnamed protein product, partial [Symbiodinium sp. KB8]